MKLCQRVTLLSRSEHLVWGKLPATLIFPQEAVIVEPTNSHSVPCNVLVGCVVSPMRGDRWAPILNPTKSPIAVQHNAKLADVSHLAVEDVHSRKVCANLIMFLMQLSQAHFICWPCAITAWVWFGGHWYERVWCLQFMEGGLDESYHVLSQCFLQRQTWLWRGERFCTLNSSVRFASFVPALSQNTSL